MADPKAAPLADELKEFALTLPSTVFPKNFFCALCSQLAVDSWKLLCCNKVICSSCQANLQFPTTCPSCDHSPLEAGSCVANKALRNTMRVWLEKRKKKEEAKVATQAPTTPVEAAPLSAGGMSVSEAQGKPVESIEESSKVEAGSVDNAPIVMQATQDLVEGAASTSGQLNEELDAPQTETERRGSVASQSAKTTETETTNGPTDESNMSGSPPGTVGNNPMMNGMNGQMGFGFPNQAGFNNGMSWIGMNQMNGMPNMMANGGWNGMNPMDFNNMNAMPNGMYGNFGGNMGMGMNDMSAMNMMGYGGGYGNGWNGMGGGFGNGNFNGNQMSGYNQSGTYPEMNQFSKNNFPNQNRFHANQGGMNPQRQNRNGSHGSFGSGFQNANSRPGSRSGLAHNRDGSLPDGTADTASAAQAEGEQTNAATEPTEEGKENVDFSQGSANPQTAQKTSTSGDESKDVGESTNSTENNPNEMVQGQGLNQIQTVESVDTDMDGYDHSMSGNHMQQDMGYPQGMMNQTQMNPSFDHTMNMGYNNNYGPRGGFNNGAYGAATVLTGQSSEPVGVGVVGAPTGPRAMREGRPNTGFSSRMNNVRYNPPPKAAAPTQIAAPTSPGRKGRSRSPMQDEGQGSKRRSPSRSRSRSRSRAKDDDRDKHRSRPSSLDRESRRAARGRSPVSSNEEDYEHRSDRRHHRSSRHDERDDDSEGRRRDDRDSRGDRTRDASTDSKYRSSRRDKEQYRSSRSHRDRSREHRRRHRSRSPVEHDKYDDDGYRNGERESDGSSRRKYRSSDKDKHRERDRSRDKERDRDRKDRKDRKERDRERDYEYEREKDRSREKDKDRRRRRDRDGEEEDERDYEDDKYRSSRRSRKDDERERDKGKSSKADREEDIVGQMMKKRAVSPPLNAPTGPSANGFSIKGRSKNIAMPPPIQPPTGPRAFQPPKGPAADRNKDRGDSRDHRRKSSVGSVPSGPATPTGPSSMVQDHYAAERERNARERDSREKVDQGHREPANKSLHSRIHSSSRPSLSSKRSRDDIDDTDRNEFSHDIPRGPKADMKAPTGPASHRDKRRKSGVAGDDTIANLFTAGLRKNAKARRGGVRTEGDVEREMERVERERDRR